MWAKELLSHEVFLPLIYLAEYFVYYMARGQFYFADIRVSDLPGELKQQDTTVDPFSSDMNINLINIF
ncbi:hypothetical protein Trydic_g4705 [Trypoxylus dichotomus]